MNAVQQKYNIQANLLTDEYNVYLISHNDSQDVYEQQNHEDFHATMYKRWQGKDLFDFVWALHIVYQ